MASYDSKHLGSSTRSSPESLTLNTLFRRQSSITKVSPTMSSPRVQLIPHTRTLSHDGSFSDSEKELLDKTSFDAKDLSSQDFDFEDIFTYDKPQKKLSRVVEVTTPSRDWSSFTFSHYATATAIRNKVNGNSGNGHGNKTRPSASEMYLRNQADARKR